MLPKDYINYVLTGVHCTDYSDASGMLLLDVKNKRWSSEMLRICGATESQLPKLYESYEAVGTLKKSYAEKFGFPEDVVVAAGAGDNAATAVRTGIVDNLACNISLSQRHNRTDTRLVIKNVLIIISSIFRQFLGWEIDANI